MSNHYHLILTDEQGVLPDFMGWLNSQLAKRIKRLRRWDEVVWEPNVHYSAVELRGEAEVLDKVAYTLLNPVSAGLVQRPQDWPGVLSTLKMLDTGSVQAQRPKVGFKDTVPKSLSLPLTPPPCFRDKSPYLARAVGAPRPPRARPQGGHPDPGHRTADDAQGALRSEPHFFGADRPHVAASREATARLSRSLSSRVPNVAQRPPRCGVPGRHLVVGPMRERHRRHVARVARVHPR
ncbi:MAG: hypothetical protein JRF54_05770 [Deltaproteobacteria bacterium]|nr:hypothetical protein [Deltaproteobacteria bacterium]